MSLASLALPDNKTVAALREVLPLLAASPLFSPTTSDVAFMAAHLLHHSPEYALDVFLPPVVYFKTIGLNPTRVRTRLDAPAVAALDADVVFYPTPATVVIVYHPRVAARTPLRRNLAGDMTLRTLIARYEGTSCERPDTPAFRDVLLTDPALPGLLCF